MLCFLFLFMVVVSNLFSSEIFLDPSLHRVEGLGGEQVVLDDGSVWMCHPDYEEMDFYNGTPACSTEFLKEGSEVKVVLWHPSSAITQFWTPDETPVYPQEMGLFLFRFEEGGVQYFSAMKLNQTPLRIKQIHGDSVVFGGDKKIFHYLKGKKGGDIEWDEGDFVYLAASLDKQGKVLYFTETREFLFVRKDFFVDPDSGWIGLHLALREGNLEWAERILMSFPEHALRKTPPTFLWKAHLGNNAVDDYDLKVGEEEGMSTLELVVRYGNPELLRLLIVKFKEMGKELDFNELRREYDGSILDLETGGKGKFPHTADWENHYTARSSLYWAIDKKDLEMARVLIENGADVEVVKERRQGNALHAQPALLLLEEKGYGREWQELVSD